MRADRRTLGGLGLVCFANLALEVLVTRLFSATMLYHFTFLALGLAMFGIAASGVYVFLRPEAFAGPLSNHLRRYSHAFALAVIAALVVIARWPLIDSSGVPETSLGMVLHLVALILVTALPFFLAGVVVSLAISRYEADIDRVYFVDLAGAALAALACGGLLRLLGGPTAMLAVASLGMVAAALFDPHAKWRWLSPGLIAVLAAANLVVPIVRLGSVKWEHDLELERWNAFSRVTVDTGGTIRIDANAATGIASLRYLRPGLERHKVNALALATWATPATSALIIGPGGGPDVLNALAAGVTDVTGVEINPIIADTIMRGVYREQSGGLYDDPRVHVVVDEGRSFVRRSDRTFDLIQATLVDTWAATAAGAFALTENTLYTVEAFEDYFAHLTERGVVTMTRWYDDRAADGGNETVRLLVLAGAALERRGVAPRDVRKHLFLASAPAERTATLIAKRGELTGDDLVRLARAASERGMIVRISPTTPGTSQLERYLDAGASSELVLGAALAIFPPTDDRPFFFFFDRLSDLFRLDHRSEDPASWLVVSIGSVFALGILCMVLPLLVRFARRREPRGAVPAGPQGVALAYFGCVGFAFMAIEVALMQRLTLFVGHPSYSLMVVLFAILISSALGARQTRSFREAALGKVMLGAGAALAVLGVLYGWGLSDVLREWIGLSRPIRIVLAGLAAAPCGFLMGLMVPCAIRTLSKSMAELIPWAWGVNGAMSVIGTSVATLIAIFAGFTATFLVGAAAYFVAGALGWLLARAAR